MRPAALPAATALLLAACSAARPPAAPAAPAPQPAPAAPTPAPSRLIRLAPAGPPRAVGTGPEGQQWLLSGGYRAVRDGARVELAEQAAAGVIEWAVRDGARWRFGTARGAFESDGFLGALREITSEGGGRPCRGTGRACSLRAGELFGAGLPARGAVIDAAFADDARGVVVFEPGSAFATDDGGATWWPVALGGGAGIAAAADGAGRWVRLSGGGAAVRVSDGGAAQALPADAMPWPAPAEGDVLAGASRVERALYEAALAGALDGERVLLVAGGRLVSYDVRTEELSPAGPEGCVSPAVLPGAGLAVRCAGASGDEVWSRDEAGHWSLRLTPARGAERCRAGVESGWLGCEGGCAPEGFSRARVCESNGVAPQRSALVSHGELLGYDEDGARWTLAVEAGAGAGADVGAAWAPAGGVRPARDDRVLPALGEWFAGGERAGARVLLEPWPSLGAGAMLRLVARGGSGRWGVLEGRAGGTFAFRAGPERARWEALGGRDGRVAVAFVPGAGWLQADAGDGEFRAVGVRDAGASRWMAAPPGEGAACGEAGCRWDGARARLGFGPVALSRFGAVGEGDARAGVGSGSGAVGEYPWRCTAEGQGVRVPDAESVVGAPREQLFVLDGPQGQAVVREAAAARGAGVAVRASWYPEGSAGGAAPEAAFQLPRFHDPGPASATRWSVVALGETAAVFSRCGAGPGGVSPGCDVLAVTAARPGTTGRAPAPAPVWLQSTASPPAVIARAPGEVALLTAAPEAPEGAADAPTPGEPRELLVSPRFAPARVDEVATAREAPGAAGVYLLDGEAGVARVLADGTVALAPPGGVPRALAPPAAGGAVGACGAFARGEVALPAPGVLELGEQGTRELALTVRYGVEQGGLCLRGVDGDVRQLGPSGWIRARAGGGEERALRGTARTRGMIIGVRCEPPAGVQP